MWKSKILELENYLIYKFSMIQHPENMKEQKDETNRAIRTLVIVAACGAGMLITGCVAAVPVAVTSAPVVHHYPATMHTSHAIHTNRVVYPAPVAVAPVAVRPVAPVARAASPVGVHGTARRTSRRVARRH